MCLSSGSPEAEPEIRIYADWVYYSVSCQHSQSSGQDREWRRQKGEIPSSLMQSNLGLIFPLVDHSSGLSFLIREKGAGVCKSLCLFILVRDCGQDMINFQVLSFYSPP